MPKIRGKTNRERLIEFFRLSGQREGGGGRRGCAPRFDAALLCKSNFICRFASSGERSPPGIPATRRLGFPLETGNPPPPPSPPEAKRLKSSFRVARLDIREPMWNFARQLRRIEVPKPLSLSFSLSLFLLSASLWIWREKPPREEESSRVVNAHPSPGNEVFRGGYFETDQRQFGCSSKEGKARFSRMKGEKKPRIYTGCLGTDGATE